MASLNLLSVFHDSGVPHGDQSQDYTTLILIHGYCMPSEIWGKLLPFTSQQNVRIVSVNRRDYPGAAPYTERDMALLKSGADPATEDTVASANMRKFMDERARELYDFLIEFVRTNKIPIAHPDTNAGGIVIVGWSLATAWMTALLANVASFPVGDIKLRDYVRCVLLHDPGYHTLGYAPPPNAWNPLFDTSLSPEEAIRKMSVWGSSYFTHGEGISPEQLEIHTPVQDPPPTIANLTEVELAWMHISEPDTLLVHHGIRLGVFDQLRKDALFLGDKAGLEGDEWSTIEVRHVLCDRSQWETTWGMWELQSEVEEGRRAGKRMRNVTFLRLRGVNHFSAWEFPERTLQAFLAPTSV